MSSSNDRSMDSKEAKREQSPDTSNDDAVLGIVPKIETEDEGSVSDTSSDTSTSTIPPRTDPVELARYIQEEGIPLRDQSEKPSDQVHVNGDKDKMDARIVNKDATKATDSKHSRKNDKRKYAPITPRGSKFDWADNKHINRAPFKLGDEQRRNELRMKIKSKDDPKAITKANSWRRQIFRRSLNKAVDTHGARPPWTVQEESSIRRLVKEKVRATGRTLSGADWQDVARKHNEKFKGRTLQAGTPLAAQPGKKGPAGSLKEYHATPLPERKARAINAITKKWAGFDQMIQDLIEETKASGKVMAGSKDEEAEVSGSEDEEEEEEEEDSDSELSANFESSDDEDIDGNIPGKTANYGTPITA
ncbi:hypothetical protein PVAG01_02802 [Phlyctema vagabunda]|uniref:Uncharacterized protein n=1 Tax=Phlyctema vagabunda TaxID=108571 RepID=A0ABR4PRV2_9HELO